VQLIDARHDPTAEDREMARYLAALGVPTLFVVTKVDKLSRSRREPQLRRIVQQLGVDPDQVVPFSARTGEGRDHLLEALEDLLSEAREAA
jgi:GTP-binding protein